MAAISASLAKSLDALRDSIREATNCLLRTPGADDAYVCVESLCTDDVRAFLEFIELEGKLQIVLTKDPAGEDDAPRELNDLPVSTRIKAAKCLPKLIELARQKSDELPPEIDAITSAIQASLANGQALSFGNELGAHQSNIPKVEIGTVSVLPLKAKK